MLTIHIGPHKTATTFVQRRMVQNRALFGAGFQTLVAEDLPLFALIEAIYPIRSVNDAREENEAISQSAYLLAQFSAETPNTLVSTEDLIGPLPSRHDIKGLYPFVEFTFGSMVKGFEKAGTPFQFVFYQREYSDWLESLYRYRYRHNPDRAFAPARFRKRHQLPQGWGEFLGRLRGVIGAGRLRVLSFEHERATGHFGQSLFDLAGLPREVQGRFCPLDPVNVSQARTVDPDRWDAN